MRWEGCGGEEGRREGGEDAAQLCRRASAHRPCPPPLLLLQVDDRLNGDGVGLIFGINDPTLFWVIAGVFTTVWAVYYAATRDVDGGDNVSVWGWSGAGVGQGGQGGLGGSGRQRAAGATLARPGLPGSLSDASWGLIWV